MLLHAPHSLHSVGRAVLCWFLLFGHVFGAMLKQNMEFCRPEREKGPGMRAALGIALLNTAVVSPCVRAVQNREHGA